MAFWEGALCIAPCLACLSSTLIDDYVNHRQWWRFSVSVKRSQQMNPTLKWGLHIVSAIGAAYFLVLQILAYAGYATVMMLTGVQKHRPNHDSFWGVYYLLIWSFFFQFYIATFFKNITVAFFIYYRVF